LKWPIGRSTARKKREETRSSGSFLN